MKQKNKSSHIYVYIIIALTFIVSNVNAAQLPVNLRTAGNFVVLAETKITTTGTTAIIGDIGISPAAASYITGFGLIMDSSNQFATSSLVTGKVYAADYTIPTPTIMTKAINDMLTAYTDAAGRALPDQIELGTGNIGGMTLAPGLYKWSTDVTIPTDVILSGNSNSVWIFQISGDLNIASAKKIILSGGAQAKNIFWQVGGPTGATLGTYSTFNGNILSAKQVVIQTGAVLNGRALAQTAVTLDANKVFSLYGDTMLPKYAILNVTKVVINDDSGNKSVEDFILKVNFKTVNRSQQFIFNPGTYMVTETKDKNYKATFSGDCSSDGKIYLRAGDVKTCTITNNDIRPYNPNANFTVTKIVINDDGGNKSVEYFILKVNEITVLSGQQSIFKSGTYMVTETKNKNYKATFSGDCSSDGKIYLRAGDVKTCTITNNDISPAKLTVTKIVINDNNGTKQVSDFILKVGDVSVVSGEQNIFSVGGYVVSEVSDSNYKVTFSGDCSRYGKINLYAGDVKTCTITNNDMAVHTCIYKN